MIENLIPKIVLGITIFLLAVVFPIVVLIVYLKASKKDQKKIDVILAEGERE